MKPRHLLPLLFLTSCATTKETRTNPDGSVSVIESRRIEDGVLPFVGRVVEAYSPRRIQPTK